MFNLLIRNGHLFRGKFKKEVFDFNTSIADFRERCEKGAGKYSKIPEEISIKEQLIEGIKLISPLFGDLKELPPILISSGVDDELFEDGEKILFKSNRSRS